MTSTLGIKKIQYPNGTNIATLDSSGSIAFAGASTVAGTLGVTGETTLATHLNLGDNDKIKLGASGDLEIYHDGSNSYVDDTGTGRLYLRGNDRVQIQKYTGEDMVTAIADGAVNLYYDNAKKFETTSSGVAITGGITSTSRHDVNFNGGSTQAFKYTDTGGGNLASFGQFYNTSNALIGNVQNANNDGIHLNLKNGSIVFSNVGYTAANALDDYEEGTFSPVFQTGGNSNGIGHSISLGTYTKVGNRVICNGFAAMNSKNGASLTGGDVTIGGLPFTVSNENNAYSAAGFRIQNISFADMVSLGTTINTTQLNFREITNSGSVTTLNDGNLASDSYVIFDISYRTG